MQVLVQWLRRAPEHVNSRMMLGLRRLAEQTAPRDGLTELSQLLVEAITAAEIHNNGRGTLRYEDCD